MFNKNVFVKYLGRSAKLTEGEFLTRVLLFAPRKVARLSAVFLIGIMSVLTGRADSPVPLQYHGGPFLETFEIHPLYYGQWKESDIDFQQAYLVKLAEYMSGKNAPALEQPMMKQYGVNDVTVAAVKTASSQEVTGVLSRDTLVSIIEANQVSGNLGAFGPHRLIMVFTGKDFMGNDFTLDVGKGRGYHASESASAFWAAVPQNAGPTLQLVTAHEVFEASASPAFDNFKGWDESVDACDTVITLKDLGDIQIPGVSDNTQGGACSTTGYTSLGEKQDYGVTHTQFVNDYAANYKQGWRLYILQAYVLDNGSPFGDVRYNAVWRPGNRNEQLLVEETHDQFLNDLNTLNSQGWNLYILQSYVLPNGTVAYNAVLRAGDVPEKGNLGETHSHFVSDLYTNYQQGYRPYFLQPYVTASGEVLYNAVWRPGDLDQVVEPQATYADFESANDNVHPQGYRLYIFQSYVVPGGEVLHNAVWRPGTHDEKAVYGSTYTDYKAEYDRLFPLGWRLYILNAYVLPGGEVRYDAVWRLGTVDRPL